MVNIGTRIKRRREELGMSQEDLANKLGYKSRSTVNKVEMGVNDIVQSKIAEYANALNTTPAYLMGWKDSEYKKVGDRIRERRIKKELSLELLSEKSGVPIKRISDLENGLLDTEDENVLYIISKIATFIDSHTFYLLGFIDEEEEKEEQYMGKVNSEGKIENAIRENGDEDLEALYNYFLSLNKQGKEQALIQLKNLTMLNDYACDYIYEDSNNNKILIEVKTHGRKKHGCEPLKNELNAAHNRTDKVSTREEKDFDNNVMDNDEF